MNIFSRVKNTYHTYFDNPGRDSFIENSKLFALEGILATIITQLGNSNVNLYATRLGATDFQISMIASLPSLAGIFILIPGALLVDRVRNKRSAVMLSAFLFGLVYFLVGMVPLSGAYSVILLLVMLPIANIPLTIYTSSWQAYFSDVVPPEKRNSAYTLRTMFTFIIGIVIPLISGQLLSNAAGGQKILIHQIFFYICFILAMGQVVVLRRIEGGDVAAKKSISMADMKAAMQNIFKNRVFIGFLGVILIFYIGWHMDWSLFFIAQIRYLGVNEAWLSYVNVANAVAQFLSVGLWSRLNEKKGVRFTIIIGGLGYVLAAVVMLISLRLPVDDGRMFLMIAYGFSGIPIGAFQLTVLQCLLESVPEGNKTLNISVYNTLIMVSNCIMPAAGVKIYTVLGADKNSMIITVILVISIRILAVAGLFIRWFLMRGKKAATGR